MTRNSEGKGHRPLRRGFVGHFFQGPARGSVSSGCPQQPTGGTTHALVGSDATGKSPARVGDEQEGKPSSLSHLFVPSDRSRPRAKQGTNVEMEVLRGLAAGGDRVNVEVEGRHDDLGVLDIRLLANLAKTRVEEAPIARIEVAPRLEPKPELSVVDEKQVRSVGIEDERRCGEVPRLVVVGSEGASVRGKSEHLVPDTFEPELGCGKLGKFAPNRDAVDPNDHAPS